MLDAVARGPRLTVMLFGRVSVAATEQVEGEMEWVLLKRPVSDAAAALIGRNQIVRRRELAQIDALVVVLCAVSGHAR